MNAELPAPATAPAPGAPWNVLAIVSLITSLVGFSLAGIITGHLSLGQLKTSGEQGHGLALAGVIIGYASIALAVIIGVIFVAAAVLFPLLFVGLSGPDFRR